ncbi:Sortase family protein [compost metagenome]
MRKPSPGILIAAIRLILILSLSVLLYSAFQIFKAPAEARQALQDWDKKREEAQVPSVQVEKEIPLPPGMVTLPVQTKNAQAVYADGEIIGEIYFPALDRRVAILEGTQRAQLKKGAGHYSGSAAIGTDGNSVLAGHRDTVFRGLGTLAEHDLIEVETLDGTFIYEVTGSTIVDGEERGAIQPSSTPVLTLITCYPFSYAGTAPERYLLSAVLIKSEPQPQKQE